MKRKVYEKKKKNVGNRKKCTKSKREKGNLLNLAKYCHKPLKFTLLIGQQVC